MLTKLIGGLAGLALGVGAFTMCNFAGGMCPLGGFSGEGASDVRPVAAMTSADQPHAKGDTCCPHGAKDGAEQRTPVINAAMNLAVNTEVHASEVAKTAGVCEASADCEPGVECPLDKATTAMGSPVASVDVRTASEGKACDMAKADCPPGEACPMTAAAVAEKASEECSEKPCCKEDKAAPAVGLTTASAAAE